MPSVARGHLRAKPQHAGTLYKYHISLRGAMVDCLPEETLLTEGWTMLSEG